MTGLGKRTINRNKIQGGSPAFPLLQLKRKLKLIPFAV